MTAWEFKPAGRWWYLYYDLHNGISRESHLGRYSYDETSPARQTNQTDKPAVLPCAQWNLNKRSRLHPVAVPFTKLSYRILVRFDLSFKRRQQRQRYIHPVGVKGREIARRAPMASIRECPWERSACLPFFAAPQVVLCTLASC